jgi:hypothetical protein
MRIIETTILVFSALALMQAQQPAPLRSASAQAAQSPAGALTNVPAPHINLAIGQSARSVAPGGRVTLIAEVKLAPRVHVYAPGAENYRVTELRLRPTPDLKASAAAYPPAKELYLPAIQERVPVFEGTFRVQQELTASNSRELLSALDANGKSVEIQGEFRYQACDDRICYLPASVPVKWQLQILPLERQRASEAIQRQ